MTKVRSITEAFSMQPATFYVGQDLFQGQKVEKIVHEIIYVDANPIEYYVGYDASNNRLFQFRKCSVNVFFDVDKIV